MFHSEQILIQLWSLADKRKEIQLLRHAAILPVDELGLQILAQSQFSWCCEFLRLILLVSVLSNCLSILWRLTLSTWATKINSRMATTSMLEWCWMDGWILVVRNSQILKLDNNKILPNGKKFPLFSRLVVVGGGWTGQDSRLAFYQSPNAHRTALLRSIATY